MEASKPLRRCIAYDYMTALWFFVKSTRVCDETQVREPGRIAHTVERKPSSARVASSFPTDTKQTSALQHVWGIHMKAKHSSRCIVVHVIALLVRVQPCLVHDHRRSFVMPTWQHSRSCRLVAPSTSTSSKSSSATSLDYTLNTERKYHGPYTLVCLSPSSLVYERRSRSKRVRHNRLRREDEEVSV